MALIGARWRWARTTATFPAMSRQPLVRPGPGSRGAGGAAHRLGQRQRDSDHPYVGANQQSGMVPVRLQPWAGRAARPTRGPCPGERGGQSCSGPRAWAPRLSLPGGIGNRQRRRTDEIAAPASPRGFGSRARRSGSMLPATSPGWILQLSAVQSRCRVGPLRLQVRCRPGCRWEGAGRRAGRKGSRGGIAPGGSARTGYLQVRTGSAYGRRGSRRGGAARQHGHKHVRQAVLRGLRIPGQGVSADVLPARARPSR